MRPRPVRSAAGRGPSRVLLGIRGTHRPSPQNGGERARRSASGTEQREAEGRERAGRAGTEDARTPLGGPCAPRRPSLPGRRAGRAPRPRSARNRRDPGREPRGARSRPVPSLRRRRPRVLLKEPRQHRLNISKLVFKPRGAALAGLFGPRFCSNASLSHHSPSRSFSLPFPRPPLPPPPPLPSLPPLGSPAPHPSLNAPLSSRSKLISPAMVALLKISQTEGDNGERGGVHPAFSKEPFSPPSPPFLRRKKSSRWERGLCRL